MRGFGVTYQTKYLHESEYILGEQIRSFLLIIEKRDYKQHILFCSDFKQWSYRKVDGAWLVPWSFTKSLTSERCT